MDDVGGGGQVQVGAARAQRKRERVGCAGLEAYLLTRKGRAFVDYCRG